jgi:prefoldin alpha subunit
MSQEMEMGIAQMDQLKAQIESIRMQRDSLGNVALDYDRSVVVMESMKSGSSEEVLLPIGGQVFVRSKILEMEKLLVDQGAGIIMDISIDDAILQIKDRKEKVIQAVSSLDRSIQDLMGRYQEISNKTQKLYNDQMMTGAGPEKTF